MDSKRRHDFNDGKERGKKSKSKREEGSEKRSEEFLSNSSPIKPFHRNLHFCLVKNLHKVCIQEIPLEAKETESKRREKVRKKESEREREKEK